MNTATFSASDIILKQRFEDVGPVHLREIAEGASKLSSLSQKTLQKMEFLAPRLALELNTTAARTALLQKLVQGMSDFVLSRNQYFPLDRSRQLALAEIYREFVGGITRSLSFAKSTSVFSRHLEAGLKEHHERLQSFVLGGLQEAGALGGPQPAESEPVCAEYATVTQLNILGINSCSLLNPILDIGCGSEGKLVAQLKLEGHQAFGVDQRALAKDYLLRASWFDIPLSRGSWGTIISHQSFCLHFLEAHLAGGERVRQFAQHYMKILQALRPGGCFYYAPGLPFMEALLPKDTFAITSSPIQPAAPLPSALQQVYGFSGITRTQICRKL